MWKVLRSYFALSIPTVYLDYFYAHDLTLKGSTNYTSSPNDKYFQGGDDENRGNEDTGCIQLE